MNMILNRSLAPDSEALNNIKIIEGQTITLSNNVDLHYINAGTSDVIKLDLIFDGGVRNQSQNSTATATSSMLREGTKNKSAEQIANELDFYGSYFQTQCTADDSSVTLFCLKKHFASCIPYVLDVINDSVFPENELNIYKKNAQQRLMVNMQRSSFLVRRLFYSSVFGETSPYGTFSEPDDYKNISRENILTFFNNHYKNNVKYLLLSGSIDESVIKTTENVFKGLHKNTYIKNGVVAKGKSCDKVFFDKKDSVQSAIRIGRRIVNRAHHDFRKLQILNMILGGYFGSRLMKNLREEKGLTYGIYSAMESFIDDGCFFIETEINNELRDRGLTEIYREIAVLRTELISDSELHLAKNYLLGSFLRSIDGPFSLAERQKILIDFGYGYDYYYEFINMINRITSIELRDLANTYLKEEDLSEIVVGHK